MGGGGRYNRGKDEMDVLTAAGPRLPAPRVGNLHAQREDRRNEGGEERDDPIHASKVRTVLTAVLVFVLGRRGVPREKLRTHWGSYG